MTSETPIVVPADDGSYLISIDDPDDSSRPFLQAVVTFFEVGEFKYGWSRVELTHTNEPDEPRVFWRRIPRSAKPSTALAREAYNEATMMAC